MNKCRETDGEWLGPRANYEKIIDFGMRLEGGGTHQSKTMMYQELDALLDTGLTTPKELKAAAIDENALGKATGVTRKLTFRHMAALYGLTEQPLLTKAFLSLWRVDKEGHRLQALLMALARDPLLRSTAPIVLQGSVGQNLQRPMFERALNLAFPGRFSEKMVRSLAQNCASTWTQSGHLEGAVKKVRRRVAPTPSTVAFAALLATVAGFGGPGILSSRWIEALDLSTEQALDQLRRAEAKGLARVRSAGDVIEISVRRPMASILGIQDLEHV